MPEPRRVHIGCGSLRLPVPGGGAQPPFRARPAARSRRSPSGRQSARATLWWGLGSSASGRCAERHARCRRGSWDMTNSALIEIDKVCKSFDGGRTFAVRDATIGIAAGAFIAVVGASGSGKTTTLKIINGLVEPDSGEVRIEGVRVGAVDAPTLRRSIGYVFQGIGLFPHMRVGENIAHHAAAPGLEASARSPPASPSCLDLVGLPRELCGAVSGRAVRRRAPARRRGARARRTSAHHADGRALRRARSGDPRRARARLPRPARAPAASPPSWSPTTCRRRCCWPTGSWS